MQRILTNLGLLIIRILSFLPTNLTMLFGSALGFIGYHIAKSRRNVGIKNLTLCFPDMSEEEKHKIIKQHFKHLMTSGLEYGLVFYASRERLKKMVQIKNLDFVLEHYEKRPVILLCPHFVGLDLAAIRLSLEVIGYSLYSRQKNSLVAEKLKEARIRFVKDKGAEIFARQEGLRPIIKRLRETKRVFGYLPDQDFGERDSIYVPFFAYPTCATVNVLPKLVSLTDAVVVPLSIHRVGKTYELEFFRAWDNYPTNNLEDDVIRMNKFVETVIMKDISQYFWLHKRFKSQPNLPRGFLYKDC